MNPKIYSALASYVSASERGVRRLRELQPQASPVDLLDMLEKIRRELLLNPMIKGAKGERGFTGQDGKDGINGKDGAAGRDGKDGLPGTDGKNGAEGKRGRDGKDGNANLAEVINIAIAQVMDHEKKHDHALLHDSLIIGSKVVDEANVAEGKILQVQGKKLVYKPLPKFQGQQIHGGGLPSQTGNSGKFLTTDGLQASWDAPSSAVSFADNEVPTGTIDGTNMTFTFAHTPTTGSLQLFADGSFRQVGASNDYTITGAVVTLAQPPLQSIVGFYRY